MPQKKNPDVPELIRGKTGSVYGALIGMLTLMKGLPLTYNRDMQEDKSIIFESVDTTLSCLALMPRLISTLKLNSKNAEFVQITTAGVKENHPHEVRIMKESPNYQVLDK